MKKNFKGFTLIECIVALAILGVASLTMAQVYGGVALANKKNQALNVSISNQVSFAEKAKETDGVSEFLFQGTDAPDTNTQAPHEYLGESQITNSYIMIEDSTGNKYSYPVDVYVLKSRDRDNQEFTGDGEYAEEDIGLNYKFFVAH